MQMSYSVMSGKVNQNVTITLQLACPQYIPKNDITSSFIHVNILPCPYRFELDNTILK